MGRAEEEDGDEEAAFIGEGIGEVAGKLCAYIHTRVSTWESSLADLRSRSNRLGEKCSTADKCCVKSQSRRSTSGPSLLHNLRPRTTPMSKVVFGRSPLPAFGLPPRSLTSPVSRKCPIQHGRGTFTFRPSPPSPPPSLPHCIGSTHRCFQIGRSGRRLSVCPITV